MIERTLVVIKPEGVQRAIIGKVIKVFENAGLKVVGLKMVLPSKEVAALHYAEDEEWMRSVGTKTKISYKEKGIEMKEDEVEIGRNIRNQLLAHLTAGPVVAMALEGNDAIFVTRKLVGGTEPRKADPSSIRGMYASDSYGMADSRKRPIKNIIHASDEPATAEREIQLWFGKGELQDYRRADEDTLF